MTISGSRDLIPGSEEGQSLVELALALPLMLLILLGISDVGRAFYYTTTIANAARAGAAYAAANASTATAASVAAKVCNETGFAPYSATPTCPGLSTSSSFGGGQDAVVTVTYDFEFLSGFLVNRVFSAGPLVIRASATYPSLAQ